MTSRRQEDGGHRRNRMVGPSLENWRQPQGPGAEQLTACATVDMGWGRLIFGHTFPSPEAVVKTLLGEGRGMRDIALYLRDPHVVLSLAPQQLFLDPSHTYRLWRYDYRASAKPAGPFVIRRITTRADAEAINRIYERWQMVTGDPDFMLDKNASRLRFYLVAESSADGSILGTVTGVDHVEAFNDPERGGSLWCLAVDPHADAPGVGAALVRHLVEHFFARGRNYVDLSVMHDNQSAIDLYEHLGFRRVPVFCVKLKNPINEPLFVGPGAGAEEKLNPYARLITDEARRRGIHVRVLDAEAGYFALEFGGRRVVCRESLTELTTAIAMSRCDDKQVTRRVLEAAGLRVPAQQAADSLEAAEAFRAEHGRVVVKPQRGEQGRGVSVDIGTPEALAEAWAEAEATGEPVLVESFETGEDLRIIVIDDAVVAAALRRPPQITATGRHAVRELIEKYNRRRHAATGGQSRIPLDAETERCLAEAGVSLQTTPEAGQVIRPRKAANLHTGGTIHDVTDRLHPALAEAAQEAARALEIPVVGLDFIVPDVEGPQYVIIEANERPGLANHEPQPTAERFIDFLFPQSVAGRPPEAG